MRRCAGSLLRRRCARPGDATALAGFGKRAAELAYVLWRLCWAPLQHAGSDHDGECLGTRPEVGVSDDGRREIRDEAPCCGGWFVRDRAGRSRLCAGRALRTPDLAVSARLARGYSS